MWHLSEELFEEEKCWREVQVNLNNVKKIGTNYFGKKLNGLYCFKL